MKKAVKRLLVLFLALTFIVTDLAVAPVTAQAAGTLKFHKTIALMKGEEIGYGIINSVRSDKVLGLKSSNTNVVSVRKMPFLGDYTITLKAKKTGTSIVSFKVKRKNGKTYSFKSKVTVHNYKNPLNVCKFGRKDYKKSFDKKRVSSICHPAAISCSFTSSARSSMMPEQRKMPPFLRSFPTCGASAMMTFATMFATITS